MDVWIQIITFEILDHSFLTFSSMTQLTDYLIRSVSLEDTSMNESNQANQSLLLIDFDWTFWNGLYPDLGGKLTFWRFGISKYDQYSILRYTF